jgi:hypothetical protein
LPDKQTIAKELKAGTEIAGAKLSQGRNKVVFQ